MPALASRRDTGGASSAAQAYCRAMLPRVSRTFALNIRVLPVPLGDVVLQAYLFCRMADTVEDSRALSPAAKPRLLEELAALFPPPADWEARASAWSQPFATLADVGADHELCAQAPNVFRAFAAAPQSLRAPVEDCVREMALGMREFVCRRAGTSPLQLEDQADLERYCHVVAGTVGTMLTRLFATTCTSLAGDRQRRMAALAERFGMAMQLTNIVKDVADDARRGACYVPRALVARHRLAPESLLDPRHRLQARRVMGELAALAALSLDAALAFTLVIPRRCVRLRLFCLWPIFLAARTLLRVLQDDALFVPGARPRIARAEVRRCLGETTLAVLSDRSIRWLYGRRQRALHAALAAV